MGDGKTFNQSTNKCAAGTGNELSYMQHKIGRADLLWLGPANFPFELKTVNKHLYRMRACCLVAQREACPRISLCREFYIELGADIEDYQSTLIQNNVCFRSECFECSFRSSSYTPFENGKSARAESCGEYDTQQH